MSDAYTVMEFVYPAQLQGVLNEWGRYWRLVYYDGTTLILERREE